MDTLSRAPNIAGGCPYPNAGWGPQPRTLDDPQPQREEVDEPPGRILPNRYISLICQYGRWSGDANREANPPYKPLARPFVWWWRVQATEPWFWLQVGTIILDILCSKDHFITHIEFHRPAGAIYCCSHSLLGKRQIGLCLSQGRLHPFKSDLHNFIHCLGKSTRHQRRRKNWVDAYIK